MTGKCEDCEHAMISYAPEGGMGMLLCSLDFEHVKCLKSSLPEGACQQYELSHAIRSRITCRTCERFDAARSTCENMPAHVATHPNNTCRYWKRRHYLDG